MPGRFTKPLSPFGKEWDAATRARIYEQFRAIAGAISALEGTPSEPSDILVGETPVTGTSQTPSPSDHAHRIPTAAPETKVALGGDSSEGSSSSVLRSDARLVLEDGATVGDVLEWNGTSWESASPISIEQRVTALENTVAILAELRTISDLLKAGLNVNDSVEDIRRSHEDDNVLLAELKTIVYFLSEGLNERIAQ